MKKPSLKKPSLPSVLSHIGHFLIGAGLLTLLFAAFQLWGTGIQEARAQGELEDEFAQLLAEVDDTDVLVTEDEAPEAENLLGSLRELPSNELPAAGTPIAVLEIESLDIRKVVVEGITRDVLRDGPGRYPDTAFPGQPGNTAIAGHRTTFGAPFFNLDKIEPGEEIKVTTLQGEFIYEVDAHENTETGGEDGFFIVEPTRTDVLNDRDVDSITLTACHPKFSAAQRLIVTATLVSEAAPETDFIPAEPTEELVTGDNELFGATEEELAEQGDAEGGLVGEDIEAGGLVGEDVEEETDELTESLNFQPDEAPAAVGFGLITLFYVYLTAWIARNWKKKTTLGLAAAPFIIILFFFFTRLERTLPAV